MRRRRIDNTYSDNISAIDTKLSAPELIGPGVWFTCHTLSHYSDTERERRNVCKTIRILCTNFKCETCSRHCAFYMTEHPPENHISTRWGLFEWTVEFHNAVNSRIGKSQYSLAQAHIIYGNPTYGVCLDCGIDEINEIANTTTSLRLTNLSNSDIRRISQNLPGVINNVGNRRFY